MSHWVMAVIGSVMFAWGQEIPGDPDAARLVTDDIGNFWDAYDLSTPDDELQLFQEYYFDEASPGLDDFLRLRIGSVENLVGTIHENRGYFDSMRESTLRIEEMTAQVRAAFYALEYLYPKAVYPDVYFLIGRMSSGGTLSERALLIGAEMYGLTEDAPFSELSDWHQQVLKPVEAIPHIVAHELIHYQQKYPDDESLLAACIMEGSADYLAELISGKHINHHLHEYGNPREEELWREFEAELDSTEHKKWLYGGDQAKGRPADLGYYMGYKITAAYCSQWDDTREAVRRVLEIEDFAQFLEDSGYADKFAAK